LVIIDTFSKFAQAYLVADMSAEAVTGAFEQWMSLMGAPQRLLTDNGTCFVSRTMQKKCSAWNVKQIFATPNHPQGNAVAERFIRTLTDVLAKKAADDPRDWDRHLAGAVASYLGIEHETTGYTPRQLAFVQDKAIIEEVRNRIWNTRPNEQVSPRPLSITEGDSVYYKDRGKDAIEAGKLALPWRGPWTVVEIVSPQVVRVQDEQGAIRMLSRSLVTKARRVGFA
jgi:hypothetical protein